MSGETLDRRQRQGQSFGGERRRSNQKKSWRKFNMQIWNEPKLWGLSMNPGWSILTSFQYPGGNMLPKIDPRFVYVSVHYCLSLSVLGIYNSANYGRLWNPNISILATRCVPLTTFTCSFIAVIGYLLGFQLWKVSETVQGSWNLPNKRTWINFPGHQA